MGTNYDKLMTEIGEKKSPFIVYDVETTGVMNGKGNCITQIALAAYEFKNGQYELTDNLFMLAKPNPEVIKSLIEADMERVNNPKKVVFDRLKSDYIYSLIKNEADEDKKEKIKKDADSLDYLDFSYEKPWFVCTNENPANPDMVEDFRQYANSYSRYEKKLDEVLNEKRIDEVFRKQGVELDTYLADDEGLTNAEMQVGITEFLSKYHKDNTVFVNNGTYFAKHYMEKAELSFLGKDDDKDKVIDLVQAQRSIKGGQTRWTADIETFAKNYKSSTGKEIKVFDALTKALCMGDITAKACGFEVSLTSENYLQKKVTESALSKDFDYVLSEARASAMKWNIATERDFYDADYHFSSLSYVNFGNDRRYVDVDKMFEMNDNFEITLEGEKTPIKTWEELETKIKSLNADISDELLDKIHEKYEEIRGKADKQRKEQLEISFNDGTLDLSDIPADDREYLDSRYDLERKEEPTIEEPRKPTYQEKAEELLRQYEELNKKKEILDTKITDLTKQNKQFCKRLEDVMDNLLAKRNEIYKNIGYNSGDSLNVYPTRECAVSFDSKNCIENHKICFYALDTSIYFDNPKFSEIIGKFNINEETVTNAFWVDMSNEIQNAIAKKSEEVKNLEDKVETMETFRLDKGSKNKSRGEER